MDAGQADVVEVELPVGLAEMPPGPQLSAALATIDRTVLSGPQLALVLRARGRQVAHDQAGMLADAVELARSPWEEAKGGTREQLDEFSADMVGWSLTISRWGACRMLDLGEGLLDGLPMVFEALLAGRIDCARAKAFREALALLDDDKAQAIATALLGKAEGWTASQLRDRLTYRAHKADPELARRRYRRGVADRRVWIGLHDDGTAQLSATHLPVDRAAASDDYIDRLARAAKAEGDPRTLDQLRADIVLDLTAGIPFQLQPSNDPFTADADREAAAEEAVWKATLKAEERQATASRTADPDRNANDDRSGKPARAEANPAGAEPPRAEPPRAEPAQAGPAGADPTGDEPRPPDPRPDARMCTCAAVRPAGRRGVVDIIVALSTLMDYTDSPGLIPGWGPVIADVARQVAFDQKTNPIWKFSVTDDSGHLLHHGHTSRRPTATEKSFVHARDRCCRAPGCTRKAIRCDIDHRRDYTKGGPSHRGNLCCLCRIHHRLKTEKGLQIHQIGPAGFMWQAPDGRLCLVPGDGNIVAIANAPDNDDGFDLDHGIPPREVRHIIPSARVSGITRS